MNADEGFLGFASEAIGCRRVATGGSRAANFLARSFSLDSTLHFGQTGTRSLACLIRCREANAVKYF